MVYKTETRIPIRDTNYCTLWQQVTTSMGDGAVAAIELISVKELNRDEVRFAYYKENPDGTLKFIPRPLDLPAAELHILLEKARNEGII
nr:hypothetical protein [Neobacillus sp. Marseille-Q6967]